MTTSDEQESADAPAGWYPDPHRPGELRYWDGSAWTDHFHRYARSDDDLPDISDWGGSTTRVLASHGLWSVVATVLPVALMMILMFVVVADLFGDIEIREDEVVGEVQAPDLLIVWIVTFVTLVLAQFFVMLSVSRYLAAAHLERPISFGAAMRGAIRKIPRAIGYGLLFVVAGIVVGGVVTGLVLAGVSASIAVALVLATIVVSVWLVVKLAFLATAIAICPSGTNALVASAQRSAGRFWPILGRLAVLWIVMIAINMAFQMVSNIGLGLAGFGDQPTIDEQAFRIAEVFPSGPVLVAFALFSALGSALLSVIVNAAVTRLYLDAGGPSDV